MKITVKIMLLCTLFLELAACTKQEPETEQPLEVNYVNLHGSWKLVELNGQALDEKVYCYIDFARGDHRFKMYENTNTMYARFSSGKFEIEQDKQKGAILSGQYDFGQGNWKNEYQVTELLASGSMIWTNVEHPSETQKFVRCEVIPQDIIDEARQ